jgi:Tlde1 domain
MWVYEQKTGRISRGSFAFVGYAGIGDGKNNPAAQEQHGVGPLPCGIYTIEAPVDTPTHGPFVLWLTPDPANPMYGRSAFGIHGDSISHPGLASEGCIIQSRDARNAIWNSGDHQLLVVSGE